MRISKECSTKHALRLMKSLTSTITGQRLKEYVTDTAKILDDANVADEKVLFEGAQGVMLTSTTAHIHSLHLVTQLQVT